MAVASASLRYVMLMIKDVPKAAAFYSEGLGLPVVRLSDSWAELDTGGGGPPLALKQADGCVLCRAPSRRLLSALRHPSPAST